MHLRHLALSCRIAGSIGLIISSYLGWNLLHYGPKYIFTPERQQCSSNLYQIGQAFRLWAIEHGGRYPFEVSTNDGGTLEYRSNYLHFTVLSFVDPTTYVCPEDRATIPAKDFHHLGPSNVSYVVNSGAKLASPETQILVQCPVHGYASFVGGNVENLHMAKDTGWSHQLKVSWQHNPDFHHGVFELLASAGTSVLLLLYGFSLKLKPKNSEGNAPPSAPPPPAAPSSKVPGS
jgi:hypothetical protein